MFSKTITSSSNFLMMPQSSQNLYFHLGMNADDDGFCEHFTIMRMTDSKPDDLKILQAKNFIKVFDDKVLIILDWKENNYLRSDRYTSSKYLEIYSEKAKRLSVGIPAVDKMDTQVRLGKDRKGNYTKEILDKALIVLTYLKSKTGNTMNTNPEQENKKFLLDRLKDGVSVEDCKSIINIKLKDNYFTKDNFKFMRCSTLFRKSNFQNYLEEAKNKQNKGDFVDEFYG